MSDSGMSTDQYVDRVRQLLDDLDADDRESVLADLLEQLNEIAPYEASVQLGTPEEFVAAYRVGAGMESWPAKQTRDDRVYQWVKLAALPLGVAVLFLASWWSLSLTDSDPGLWSTIVLISTGLLVATTLGYLLYESERRRGEAVRPSGGSQLRAIVLFLVAIYLGVPIVLALAGMIGAPSWPPAVLVAVGFGIVGYLVYRSRRR